MARFLLFILLLTLCKSHDFDRVFSDDPEIQQQRFNEFKNTFGKVYETEEENSKRFDVFIETLKMIDELNAKYNKNIFKITQFAATPQSEMEALNKLQSQSLSNTSHDTSTDTNIPNTSDEDTTSNLKSRQANAASVDYRNSGFLTSIVDQGGCGSCFAFAACAVMEYQWKKMGEEISHFSAQYFVNCCETQYCNGCSGGQPADVFRYSQENGMPSTALFGYTGTEGPCFPSNKFAGAKDITIFQPSQTSQIVNYLETVGPMATGMYASGAPFKVFAGGDDDIVSNTICDYNASTHTIDHAITVVGYRYVSGNLVWIVRNSWGTNWGNKGYFQVYASACGFNKNEYSGSLVEHRSSSFYLIFGILVAIVSIIIIIVIILLLFCFLRKRINCHRSHKSSHKTDSLGFELEHISTTKTNFTANVSVNEMQSQSQPQSQFQSQEPQYQHQYINPPPAYDDSSSSSSSSSVEDETAYRSTSARPTLSVAQVSMNY